MPLYKVDVEKLLATEYWSNRYLVEANTIQDAADEADAIVATERTFHSGLVTFTKVRTSEFPQGGGFFIVKPIGLAGQRVVSGDLLPLFVTVRVDFPAGLGRPSRKYYRGCIGEGDIVGANMVAGSRTFIQTSVNAFDPRTLVDPQVSPLGTGVVQLAVQMRQLRRGTKRRQNPIIP